jgi:hypothetical protein
MSSDDRELQEIRNRIAFRLDCKQWMDGPLGQYLARKANDQRDAALEVLAITDAENAPAIRHQQNRIRVADMFLEWMGEAVTEGENAERAFIESQD